uniref:Uncharacterized protein n=1 Tax=Anguilla anguilla TaxID=7936 RepID=A0A0E9VLX1_ANGAN
MQMSTCSYDAYFEFLSGWYVRYEMLTMNLVMF